MIRKRLKLQEKVTIWSRRTVEVDCPDGESDEDTIARLSRDGVEEDAEVGDNDYLSDTEEPIANQDTDAPYTFELETKYSEEELDDEDDDDHEDE